MCAQEEAFHLVDNRPTKTNKFGQGRNRFQQQQRYAQQRRDKEAKGIEEKKKGPQGQKGRQPWQQYGRDNQRVSPPCLPHARLPATTHSIAACLGFTRAGSDVCSCTLQLHAPHVTVSLHVSHHAARIGRAWAEACADDATLAAACMHVLLQTPAYTSSVEVKPDWTMVEQINFPALVKLSLNVGEAEDLRTAGTLEYYDKVCVCGGGSRRGGGTWGAQGAGRVGIRASHAARLNAVLQPQGAGR